MEGFRMALDGVIVWVVFYASAVLRERETAGVRARGTEVGLRDTVDGERGDRKQARRAI
jgi:hypothetical protein